MKLTDLQPEWVNYTGNHTHQRYSDSHSHVTYTDEMPCGESLAQADGLLFLCPTCFRKNGGSVGTESVLVWFSGRGVPDDELPGPGRWGAHGNGFEDLTLTPSINVDHDHWHGWITNGEIR